MLYICFLGSFEIFKESHVEVKESLEEMLSRLKNVTQIEHNNIIYQIKFFLCCDYKMLRGLYGHKESNAKYGCAFCHKDLKTNKPDLDQKLTIDRTLKDEIYKDPPIIDFIEYKDCVIDVLHLFLRITDNLLDLLISKLNKVDKNDSSNIELRPTLKIFLDFLKDNCKISNPYYVSKKEDKIKLRNLNANERARMFDYLFEEYFRPNETQPSKKNFYFVFKNAKNLKLDLNYENLIWSSFYEIYKKLSSHIPEIKKTKFKKHKNMPNIDAPQEQIDQNDPLDDLRLLLDSYQKVNFSQSTKYYLTPYWHCFYFHVKEMLQ